jgi:hypothetical protein
MANPYRDKNGRFSSKAGGSGGKASSGGGGKASAQQTTKGKQTQSKPKSRTTDFSGFRYVGKEGKQFVVTNGPVTKYLNNKEFGEFSRQALGFKEGPKKAAASKPAKTRKTRERDRPLNPREQAAIDKMLGRSPTEIWLRQFDKSRKFKA